MRRRRPISSVNLAKRSKVSEIEEALKLCITRENTKRNGVGIAVSEYLNDMLPAVQRLNDRTLLVEDPKEAYRTTVWVYPLQTGGALRDRDDIDLTFEEVIKSAPEGHYVPIPEGVNELLQSVESSVKRVHGDNSDDLLSTYGEEFSTLLTTLLSSASLARGKAR
ncbi:unnamed protein product [Heligmosomoides polygyrus]|uniref:HATPase_c domain-containing protein n=1 Tax=Heligmosomoides polygyrus TaxID=6339 RepID=A0A183FPU5_HELPZ|nr:unnamed protein product [Heligmosomoides polygyrus]